MTMSHPKMMCDKGIFEGSVRGKSFTANKWNFWHLVA